MGGGGGGCRGQRLRLALAHIDIEIELSRACQYVKCVTVSVVDLAEAGKFLTLLISSRIDSPDKVLCDALNVWDVVVGAGGSQHVLLYGLSHRVPRLRIGDQPRAGVDILQLLIPYIAEYVKLWHVRDPWLVSVHHFLIFRVEKEEHVFTRQFESDNISILLVDLPPEPVHPRLVLLLSQQRHVSD